MHRLLLAAAIGFATLTQSALAAPVVLDQVAIVVDDSVILKSDIDKRLADVRHQLAERQGNTPPEEILRKQVIDQIILETLQVRAAERSGIRLDDAAVTAALEDIARQNKVSLPEFQAQLNSTPGTSYNEVREQVKREMQINRLRQSRMQSRIRITDQDVENFLKSPQGEAALSSEYRLNHILIALPDAPTPEQSAAVQTRVDEAITQLKNGTPFADVAAKYSSTETALKGGDLGWRKSAQLPTLFTDLVGDMKKGEFAGPIRTPTGIHIIQLADKRGADSISVEQYRVRHILIKPTEILSTEDARQELESIRQRIISGSSSFEEMAKIHSDDPGSARNGGDLNWVTKGDMVPEFEAKMLSTPLKQVTDVFQSAFGWHILEVTEKRNQDMSAQVKANMARQALYNRQVDEELSNWLREIRTEAYVDIKPIAYQ